MQIEGAIIMGLGYCLSEEIHFNGGTIQDLNFGSYKIPRFSWVPEIEPVLVENLEIAPSGLRRAAHRRHGSNAGECVV